ncbi:MAG: SOS response-associated peptidase [Variovorax sp.]|nr:MAG: SOS response-associated peptidase [Variovorax sp.]
MCSHYQAAKSRAKYEKRFGLALPPEWEPPRSSDIYPTQFAPIIRRPAERESGDEAVPELEVVPARFGLLPGFAKEVKYGTRTYNARSETVATLASFKHAWAKGRHCIVPADAFYEPDWRTGTHVPTRFSTADGELLGIAGIWSPWKSPEGEWVDTFAMLTINADDHELFKHMHRPDPKRPPEMQDKRMVVILPVAQYRDWLDAPAANSMQFMRSYPADRLAAMPEPVHLKKPASPKEAPPPAEPQLF